MHPYGPTLLTRPSKMEIYHRDHWIIIVHTATWKDLTKWNEENTISDWINHMGRIVEHVFPKPSARWPAYEKDYRVYYVLSHISISSQELQVAGCIRLYHAVLACT